MKDRDEAARIEIRTRLAASRQELRRVLDPPRSEGVGADGASGDHLGGFPRSRTMQLLMSGRGLGTVGAVVAGLLLARPALALRLLRMLPASAVARMVLARAFSSMRARQDQPR
jgi:hypothetical protein